MQALISQTTSPRPLPHGTPLPYFALALHSPLAAGMVILEMNIDPSAI